MAAAEVALRLDTEDFLTPESDAALAAILDVLEANDAPATFPVVARKLETWQARPDGRALRRRLARHAVGYHSATHSLHPTIAEEASGLTWLEAQAAFAAREAAGFAQVREAFGPPACYTQPGGNWTASALAVLRRWGVPCEYSEGWNSYIDCGTVPVHYAGLLHWSAPVAAPKPFLTALPAALDAALDQVRAALAARAHDDPPVNVVAHPTELCTTAFWDAVNFGRGRMPPQSDWRPAPLRPEAEIAAAAAAFARYIQTLRREGVRFVTIRDLVARHPDRTADLTLESAEVTAFAPLVHDAATPLQRGGIALSAAETLCLLCRRLSDPPGPLRVASCDGPGEPPPPAPRGGADRTALAAAAAGLLRFVDGHGRLPAAVTVGQTAVGPAEFLGAVSRAVADPTATSIPWRPCPLLPAECVKPPERLHWDWAVFPADFRPLRLWEAARLQTWTLRPAPTLNARPTGSWQRWLPRATGSRAE